MLWSAHPRPGAGGRAGDGGAESSQQVDDMPREKKFQKINGRFLHTAEETKLVSML